jgi:hypothetical protein
MVTLAQIAAIYTAERAAFARTFPAVADVQLLIITEHYKPNRSRRDVAWYDSRDRSIYLVSNALRERSAACLTGVLRHELGHAADPRLDAPGCERRADRIALIATGQPILYTQEGIQHSTHGVPYRPDWLHQ